jgi:hypothetical protein
MEAVPGDEGGAALFQRRRGLAGAGLLPAPDGVDRVLHCLARHADLPFSSVTVSAAAARWRGMTPWGQLREALPGAAQAMRLTRKGESP